MRAPDLDTYHNGLICDKQNPSPSRDAASTEDASCHMAAQCAQALAVNDATAQASSHSSVQVLASIFLAGGRIPACELTVSLLCQSESNFHRAPMKATDSVCDLKATLALFVFTQAGNVLMGTAAIVRTRG